MNRVESAPVLVQGLFRRHRRRVPLPAQEPGEICAQILCGDVHGTTVVGTCVYLNERLAAELWEWTQKELENWN